MRVVDVPDLEKLTARFWAKVRKSDGCWLWIGSQNRGGYGQFMVNGKVRKAHRVSYMIHAGEVPDHLDTLHTCDRPSCVRPDHLFLGTAADNMADMRTKGRDARAPAAINAAKTHCKRGHPYAGEHLRVRRDGARTCVTCERVRIREVARRRRARLKLSLSK